MDYVKNHLLFIVGGFVSLFVIVQSSFFIVKALREGKRMGISTEKIRKAISSSVIFSIVPSLAILLTVVTLSKSLGLALPWIRLSVIGAISYEVPAAEAAAKVFGSGIGNTIDDPVVFSTIAWVMTMGSIFPLFLIPIFLKRIQGGISSIKNRDSRWGELLMSAIFIGMISAFIGAGIAGSVSGGVVYGSLVSILTLMTSALIMGLMGLIINKYKLTWLENFALPISMLGAMAASIMYWNLLPDAIRSWRIPGIL